MDPGPLDKQILTDQDNHISKVIWEGQVESILSFLNFNIILLFSDGSSRVSVVMLCIC